MKSPKFWDEYEIKARYIPTFLTAVPLMHSVVLLLGQNFWGELATNISWMLVADMSLSLLIVLALVQIQCGFAKHWVEEPVFGKGGE